MYTTARRFSAKLPPMDQLQPYMKNKPSHSPSTRACRPAPSSHSKPPASTFAALRHSLAFVQTTGLKPSFTDAKLELTTPSDSRLDLTAPISKFFPEDDFAAMILPRMKLRQMKVNKGKLSQIKVRPAKNFPPGGMVYPHFRHSDLKFVSDFGIRASSFLSSKVLLTTVDRLLKPNIKFSLFAGCKKYPFDIRLGLSHFPAIKRKEIGTTKLSSYESF